MVRLYQSLGFLEKTVAEIASLEVRSAIRRRQRANDFSASEADRFIQELEQEFGSTRVIPVTRALQQSAAALIDNHGLKSLDSIQLASALSLRSKAPSLEIRFAATDAALLTAAHAEGFLTWNPASTTTP